MLSRALRSAAARLAAYGAAGGASLALGSHALHPPAECRIRSHQSQGPGNTEKHQIVVVGGGSAGLSVAAQLMRKLGKAKADIAVIEPSDYHYYRPSFTFAGAGITPIERSRRPMDTVILPGMYWIKGSVTAFEPQGNAVVLSDGARVEYDYLIVATGMQTDLTATKGLEDALRNGQACTIWDYDSAPKVWDAVRELREGTAIFTQPKLSRGCGGAPQKIMWLADDWWRSQTLTREDIHVAFITGRDALFPIDKYAQSLAEIADARGVDVRYHSELVEVDGENRLATFEDRRGKRLTLKYDLLHVTPHMGAPTALAASPLAAENGFVDVDKYTLQHVKFPNVFALGDAANLPTSKTAAAITAQAPVLVNNLLSCLNAAKAPNAPGTKPDLGFAHYDGYSSSPILTKRGGLILAEFKYDGNTKETFPWWFDQAKEQSLLYNMHKGFFPWAYWNLMLTGRWYGPRGIFEPRLKFIDTWAMP